MSSNHCSQLDLFDCIHDFVVASADCELTKDQWTKFEEFLWENDDACQMYLEYAQESNVLQTILESMSAENSPSSDIICVEPRESASPTFLSNTFHGIVGYLCDGIPQGYLIGAVITGLVLLILANVYVSDPARGTRRSSPAAVVAQPKAKYVGRITGMVDCKIGDSRVFLGQKLNLASGLTEITYDTGAKVILQGPVMYEVETNGGYLAVGKLTGKLEKKLSVVSDQQSEKVVSGQWPVASETNPKSQISKSQISNPQSLAPFVIHTPTATVTDLSTEFGVEVDKDGATTSHVFRGSVELLVAADDGEAEDDTRVLHENQSARVEKQSGNHGGGSRVTVFDTPAKSANFVRGIPKQTIKVFDLVDVVAGGDGFSHRRDRGIIPLKGQMTDTLPKPGENLVLAGDWKYHRVEGSHFVDGVFTPDGSHGPVQVDSAGHRFADFPRTSNLSAYIWAGGVIPLLTGGKPPHAAIPTDLGGIDYSASDHGLIFLHASNAVTFDLDAIRRANPGDKLVRFRAVAGDAEIGSSIGGSACADLWVLVDGQARFKRMHISRHQSPFWINIPLGEKDRFLTLASTDGGDGIDYDWTMFGDPRLEFAVTNATDDSTPSKKEMRDKQRRNP